MHRSFLLVVALVAILALPVSAQEGTPVGGEQAAPLTVVASGLINPRGVTWTADGTIWVAQAGSGGQQLGTPTAPPPRGPDAGRTDGQRRARRGRMPRPRRRRPALARSRRLGEVLGAEDLAVLGDQLYAAVDGGGESHGNAAQPSGVYRILGDGTSELVADLSAWVRANPVAQRAARLRPGRGGVQPGGRCRHQLVLGRRPQQRSDPERRAGRDGHPRGRPLGGPSRAHGAGGCAARRGLRRLPDGGAVPGRHLPR